jgi:hypothetical protein
VGIPVVYGREDVKSFALGAGKDTGHVSSPETELSVSTATPMVVDTIAGSVGYDGTVAPFDTTSLPVKAQPSRIEGTSEERRIEEPTGFKSTFRSVLRVGKWFGQAIGLMLFMLVLACSVSHLGDLELHLDSDPFKGLRL